MKDYSKNTIPKKRSSPYKHRVKAPTKSGKGVYINFSDEGLEQLTVADWLRAHKVFFLHIPNEGKRDAREGLMLKMLGLEPGAADIIIFDAPPRAISYKGTVIEMKTKTGKLTTLQTGWLNKMRQRGYYDFVGFGADKTITMLMSLGYSDERN